ncbi:MAG: helix-turn-helix domain-containing protein, partial [Planctomycetaceae bacterium]|nr:helix-turn-helix domain-containing protein [Planctomycetaceae bacterium]
MPFSALPHELRKSLKGNQTAIVLAATLLEYAKTKAYCYPSNATLAEDMGCCVSTIRNALAALRA